jgi:hypothetical protein
VYRLPLDEPVPADPDALGERDRLRLAALAGRLVREVRDRDDDAGHPDRVDLAGPMATAATADVTLTLHTGAGPGVYVVMWEVLAVDTHWSEDFFLLFAGGGER